MQTLHNYQQKFNDYRKTVNRNSFGNPQGFQFSSAQERGSFIADASHCQGLGLGSSASNLTVLGHPSAAHDSNRDTSNSQDMSINEGMMREHTLESSAAFDPNYMKEGYLQKKGQLLKGWKRRWFVCDGRTLTYYTSHKDKKANAVIPLDACTVQDGGISETWNSPRIYLTDGTSGTMYCLSAEEGDVVAEWLTVLRNAVSLLQGHDESGVLPILPFDEEEGRGKPKMHPMHRSPQRPSVKPPAQAFFQKKRKQVPTNKLLEGQLNVALQSMESFLKPSKSWTLVKSKDGVRISVLESAESNSIVVRGSVVVDAAPDIVCYLISDIAKRSEWDVQFPHGNVIASYGSATELVHISGHIRGENPLLVINYPPVGSIAAGASLGLAAGIFAGIDTLTSAISGASFFGILSGCDVKHWCKPRELLIVKHVRKNSDGSSIVVESSVSSELKPTSSNYVRAHSTAGGFLIQPVVDDPTDPVSKSLLTYITDIDAKGWLTPSYKRQFLIDRMECLTNIREYIIQARVFGEDLGYTENSESWGTETEEGVSRSDFVEEDAESDWDPGNWSKGMARIPTGGLKLTDKEIAKKQKGVLLDVLKSFGAAILEGKSAVSLSLPVRIFEPRSMLERLVDSWIYAPTFLNKAAKPNVDPLERFKLVMAFAVSGLHHCVAQLKPFNPILGETYQAELADGTSIYCEHTSHHPPISNFQVFGAGYMLWGYFIFSGSFKTNALTQTQTGPVNIDFDDGGRISYNMPMMRNGGFLWGDRVTEFLGEMIFTDEKNKLHCELRFNPDEKKGMGGMFSASKTPSDHCRGVIVDTENQRDLCEVQGSWLEDLRFGETVYWDVEKDNYTRVVKLPNVLPSDCRYREDLQYLKKGDPVEAQEWKLKLEKLQRADRALRKDGRRENHWANNSGH